MSARDRARGLDAKQGPRRLHNLVSLLATLGIVACSPAYSESFRKEAAKQTLVDVQGLLAQASALLTEIKKNGVTITVKAGNGA